MSIATITLYGRNDDPTSSIVDTVATVETGVEDTDYWKWETEVFFIDAKIADETETNEYLNSYKDGKLNYRMQYDIVFKPIDFPSTSTDIDTLFPFLNILDKKFIWLHLNDYPITCYTGQSTNAIQVYKDSSFDISSVSGQKEFSCTFLEKKRSRDHT